MMKKCLVFLIMSLFFTSCTPNSDWDHSAETIIIRTTDGGGMEPEAAVYNALPKSQLWGDGRIVWQTQGQNNERLMWQGHLSQDEMAELLQIVAKKGFWGWENHYRPKGEVYDGSSINLTVNLLAESKNVSEYHEGAPRNFHKLVTLISTGAGVEGTPYFPEKGHLSARAFQNSEGANTSDYPFWNAAEANLSLADANGVWIEGDALLQAWEAVNRSYGSPQIVDDGVYYFLFLNIPELSQREPQ